MATVAVAGDGGLVEKTAGEALGAVAGEFRIVFEGADVELAVALGHRREQLEQVRHRAVVQVGRGGPDAVQRAGLVGAQLLHADGQAVAVHALLFRLADVGVAIGAAFDEGGYIGQALRGGNLAEIDLLGIAADELDVHPLQLGGVPLQCAQVVLVVGDVVGGGRVGADFADRHQLHPPLRHAPFGEIAVGAQRLHMRAVAIHAIGLEQRTTKGGALQVDLAEQFGGPGRRPEALEGFFEGVEVTQAHAGGIALVAHYRLAVAAEHAQGGANAEGFADVARHGLHGRAVPLHPVEFPDVPDLRVVHRRVGHAVVGRVDAVAEHTVGDAPEGVGAAGTFEGRVEAAMGIVPGGAHQLAEQVAHVAAQGGLAFRIAAAEHLLGEAVELPRHVVGGGEAGAERLAEGAAAQRGYGGGDGVHGRATVDAQRLVAVTQLAGVAGRAGDIEIPGAALAVLMAGEADRQVAGVAWVGCALRCRLELRRIDQETEAGEIGRVGELVGGEGLFERDEPLVAQSLNLGSLGRVVVGLAGLLVPLREQVELFRWAVGRQIGVGGVPGDDAGRHQYQQQDGKQDTSDDAHRNFLVHGENR
ncbi:hypothetical protein D3C78_720970 [compost metagenome]